MKEFKYTIDGKEYQVTIGDINNNVAEVTVNGQNFQVELEQQAEPEKKNVVLGTPTQEASSEEVATPQNVNTANAVKAPLPGTIININVAVGDTVKTGDTVCVLEAMKMANNIEAERDGKVTAVLVKQGQSVMEEEALVVIE